MSGITQPIPGNQIVDVSLSANDWACLTAPNCPNLPNTLKLLITEICSLKNPGFDQLDFGCVDSADTLVGILQNILNNITCEQTPPADDNVNDKVLTGLTECSSDGWDCDATDACFSISNECNPGVLTVKVVIQALIDRIVAQGNMIKSLCSRLTTAESDISTLQSQVTTLMATCCPG